MLALARNLAPADQSMKAEKWDRKSFAGVELFGKRLGVIGFGRIGREVAARCRAFGMEVQAFDPFVSAAVAEQAHVKLRTLEEVLQTSDYLTLHTTLTKETKHLIGKDALAKVKNGVRIVNAARGELIDDDALLAALDSGRVAGAGPRRPPAGAAEGLAARRSTRRCWPCRTSGPRPRRRRSGWGPTSHSRSATT